MTPYSVQCIIQGVPETKEYQFSWNTELVQNSKTEYTVQYVQTYICVFVGYFQFYSMYGAHFYVKHSDF